MPRGDPHPGHHSPVALWKTQRRVVAAGRRRVVAGDETPAPPSATRWPATRRACGRRRRPVERRAVRHGQLAPVPGREARRAGGSDARSSARPVSLGPGGCGAGDRLPPWTAVLQVQGLSVEVGGRLRRRRRLVHRHAPRQGRPRRPQRRRQDQPVQGARRRARAGGRPGRSARAASATCRRTRASTGVLDGRTAITHVLSGRGIDDAAGAHREAAHRDGGGPERAQRRPLQQGPGRVRHVRRLRGGERGARIAAGLGLPDDRMDLPIGVLSGGERRRVELARILFAGSDVLLLDEPTNHLDVDAKTWLLRVPAQVPRRAAGDQPRPRAARRGDHPRAPPRPAGTRTPSARSSSTRAPTASTARRGPPTRSASPRKAMLQAKEIARLQTHRRPLRRQGHEGGDGAQQGEADRPPRGAAGRRSARPIARCGCASPIRRPAGVTVHHRRTGCRRRYGGPPVFEDVAFDLGRGERLLVLGLNGAGKTSLLRILAGETEANLGDFTFGHNVNVGYYAQEHDNLQRRRRRCSTTSAPPCPTASCSPRPSCAACSA